MASNRTQLIFFSGIGADERLLEPQLRAFPELIVPPWLMPGESESISHYAQRWAARLPLREPFYLGGISFGGLVALEMARYVRPTGVFLLSSCRNAKYINGLYRLALLAPSVVPRWLTRAVISTFGGPGLTWHEGLDAQSSELITRIAKSPVMPIVEWGGRQMATWRLNVKLTCPIHQIHGALDTAIYPQPRQTDLLVPDGRHLVNLTHPQVTNDFIRSRLVSR